VKLLPASALNLVTLLQLRASAATAVPGLAEVTAGLEPKSRVVDTGAGFVKDGELVRVAPAESRVARLGEQS